MQHSRILHGFKFILFYFLFHKFTSQFEMQYLAPAMISFSNVLTLFVANIIATDRIIIHYKTLATPLKSYEFILGYSLTVLPIGLIQTVINILGCLTNFIE